MPASNGGDAEASALCAVVEQHAAALRKATFGRRARLAGHTFHLQAQSRNTIYRVAAAREWFLKLPVREGGVAIVHEQFGGPIVHAALRGVDGYAGAAVTRTSLRPAYTLATRVAGVPLNRLLFTRCWDPLAGAMLERRFRLLGTAMAHLHERARLTAGVTPATTRPFETLAALLSSIQRHDAITTRLRDWHDANVRSDDGDGFIHGNLRFDNVLSTDTAVGFIDFENCGSGSWYQDLSRPVTELLLTQCIVGFPHRRAERCLRGLLDAYRACRRVDDQTLAAFVGARLGRYYVETRAKSLLSRRIGGLPVTKRRLDRLLLETLDGRIRGPLPALAHAQ